MNCPPCRRSRCTSTHPRLTPRHNVRRQAVWRAFGNRKFCFFFQKKRLSFSFFQNSTAGVIESASKFHAPALAEIHRQAFPPDEAWSEAALAVQLQAPGGFGLVAPAGGFALARVIVDEAELLTLAVLPGMRRQGVGSALVRAVAAEAAGRGAAHLFLEVSERNCAARALYAAVGFTQVGRRRRYYPDGSDALLLRLGVA